MTVQIIRNQIRMLFESHPFRVQCCAMAAVSFVLSVVITPEAAQSHASFFEVLLYTLGGHSFATLLYPIILVLCNRAFAPPEIKDVYIIARSGCRPWLAARLACISLQAICCCAMILLGAALGCFPNVSYANRFGTPGIVLPQQNDANVYYLTSIILKMTPLHALLMQFLLSSLYYSFLALCALVFGLRFASSRLGTVAAMLVHFLNLAIYYIPVPNASWFSLFNYYLLYEYIDPQAGMIIIKLVIFLAIVGAMVVASLCNIKHYPWLKIRAVKI